MTACTCPLAGYCDRHGIDKSEHWHQLCQTRDNYRAAWDEGRGPGQPRKPLTAAQIERQERVKEASNRTARLIGWLTFFRANGDAGIGDTSFRMVQQATRRSPDAKSAIVDLLKQCSCSRIDAVARLNKEHPYPANTRSVGGS